MPFARILTRYSEDAAAISGQLQSLGYTVEIAAPEAPRSTPADLEIDLERCPAGTALARAEQLARDSGADIFVAPGAATAPDSAPPNHCADRQVQVAPLSQAGTETSSSPSPDRAKLLVNEQPPSQPSEPEAVPSHDRGNSAARQEFAFLSSYASVPPIAGDQSTKKTIAASLSGILSRAANSARATFADLAKSYAEDRDAKRAQRELAREVRAQAQAQKRASLATAAAKKRARAEEEAAARRQREAILAAQAAQARQEAETRLRAQAELRVRTEAEMRARAEAEALARKQAEERARAIAVAHAQAEIRARQEAEARTRAAAEHARAEAARAHAETARAQAASAESERLTASAVASSAVSAPQPNLPANQTITRPATAPASIGATLRIRVPRVPVQSVAAGTPPLSRNRTLLLAAALAIVVMIGWTVALQRQPESAMTIPSNTTLEQELPFGPVKLVPKPAAKPAHVTPAPVAQSPQAASALPQSDAPPDQKQMTTKTPAAIKPQARRRTRQPDSEIANDEVIVHHYGATATPNKTVVNKTGPRHISDID